MPEIPEKVIKDRDGLIIKVDENDRVKMEVEKDEVKSVGDYNSSPVYIYHDWCVRCGICVAFCPTGVLTRKSDGSPFVEFPEKCIHCETCDRLCPNFAITGAKK